MECKEGTLPYSPLFCTPCASTLGSTKKDHSKTSLSEALMAWGLLQLRAPRQEGSVGAGCPCHALCKGSQAPYPAPAWLPASLHPTEGLR